MLAYSTKNVDSTQATAILDLSTTQLCYSYDGQVTIDSTIDACRGCNSDELRDVIHDVTHDVIVVSVLTRPDRYCYTDPVRLTLTLTLNPTLF